MDPRVPEVLAQLEVRGDRRLAPDRVAGRVGGAQLRLAEAAHRVLAPVEEALLQGQLLAPARQGHPAAQGASQGQALAHRDQAGRGQHEAGEGQLGAQRGVRHLGGGLGEPARAREQRRVAPLGRVGQLEGRDVGGPVVAQRVRRTGTDLHVPGSRGSQLVAEARGRAPAGLPLARHERPGADPLVRERGQLAPAELDREVRDQLLLQEPGVHQRKRGAQGALGGRGLELEGLPAAQHIAVACAEPQAQPLVGAVARLHPDLLRAARLEEEDELSIAAVPLQPAVDAAVEARLVEARRGAPLGAHVPQVPGLEGGARGQELGVRAQVPLEAHAGQRDAGPRAGSDQEVHAPRGVRLRRGDLHLGIGVAHAGQALEHLPAQGQGDPGGEGQLLALLALAAAKGREPGYQGLGQGVGGGDAAQDALRALHDRDADPRGRPVGREDDLRLADLRVEVPPRAVLTQEGARRAPDLRLDEHGVPPPEEALARALEGEGDLVALQDPQLALDLHALQDAEGTTPHAQHDLLLGQLEGARGARIPRGAQGRGHREGGIVGVGLVGAPLLSEGGGEVLEVGCRRPPQVALGQPQVPLEADREALLGGRGGGARGRRTGRQSGSPREREEAGAEEAAHLRSRLKRSPAL